MTSPKIFGDIPQTKAEIAIYAKNIEDMFLNGEHENLSQFKALKTFEGIIKQALSNKKIKEAVLNEWYKHGQKVELYGAVFSKSEAGTTYDYSGCDDKELSDLTEAMQLVTEKVKQRQEFLKAISPDSEVFNSYGVRVFAPVKKSETIIKCEIK